MVYDKFNNTKNNKNIKTKINLLPDFLATFVKVLKLMSLLFYF